MHISLLNIRSFIVVVFITLYATTSSCAPTIRTAISDGDWDDPTIWSPAGIPDCTNDFIYIDVGITVSFTSTQDLEGCGNKIELIIYGV